MAYHSITFEEYKAGQDKPVRSENTWTSWRLIPSAPPVIQPAQPTFNYVSVPGSSTMIDLSTYLTGSIIRSERTGSFSFYVANEDPETLINFYGEKNARTSWVSRKRRIESFLDGSKILRMILEDDPSHYYRGRFLMKEWTPGANNSMVSIEYHIDADTYSTQDWPTLTGITQRT